MLGVKATNDKALLNKLSEHIYGAPFEGGVGFVLEFENATIGLAKLTVSEYESVIHSVGIVLPLRNRGFGDFMTRSLMDNLSRVSKKIIIAYKSEYFKKFGFKEDLDTMFIASEDIMFPSKCKH